LKKIQWTRKIERRAIEFIQWRLKKSALAYMWGNRKKEKKVSYLKELKRLIL
jgi:hypothetical protein